MGSQTPNLIRRGIAGNEVAFYHVPSVREWIPQFKQTPRQKIFFSKSRMSSETLTVGLRSSFFRYVLNNGDRWPRAPLVRVVMSGWHRVADTGILNLSHFERTAVIGSD